MDSFAKGFVIASLIYLLMGTTLGVVMVASSGGWKGIDYYLIPVHTHLNLVGWVSMMIFGVLYHILPRFSGKTLYSKKLAWAHFFLSQVGLLGMALFLFLNRYQEERWRTELGISGFLLYVSILLFVWNMYKTLTNKVQPLLLGS